MLDNYLIIHKSILPEYYEKVLAVRHLLEDGKTREVSQAVKEVGISRSTYYKYKDFILEPSEMDSGRKAVLSMLLTHETGVLSNLLGRISEQGGAFSPSRKVCPSIERPASRFPWISPAWEEVSRIW